MLIFKYSLLMMTYCLVSGSYSKSIVIVCSLCLKLIMNNVPQDTPLQSAMQCLAAVFVNLYSAFLSYPKCTGNWGLASKYYQSGVVSPICLACTTFITKISHTFERTFKIISQYSLVHAGNHKKRFWVDTFTYMRGTAISTVLSNVKNSGPQLIDQHNVYKNYHFLNFLWMHLLQITKKNYILVFNFL